MNPPKTIFDFAKQKVKTFSARASFLIIQDETCRKWRENHSC